MIGFSVALAGSIWPVDHEVLRGQATLPCTSQEWASYRPDDVTTWTMTFTADGRLASRANAPDPSRAMIVARYAYEGARLVQLETQDYNSREVTRLAYDAEGREVRREQITTTTRTVLGGPATERVMVFELGRRYDPDGTVYLGATLPTEPGMERWTYREGKLVETTSGAVRHTYSYTVGLLTERVSWSGEVREGVKRYRYDAEGRLVETAQDLRGDGTAVLMSTYGYACG